MKRRFIKRYTLVETVGKKPRIISQTYDKRQVAIWQDIQDLDLIEAKRDWSVETETVMLLSANGALPTHR